jgi:hypothetical protein
MGRKPAEQRISPRIAVHTPAVVKFEDEQLTGYVELVNLNGMFVASPRFPTLGEFVDLIVNLPGTPRSFRVRATVVHAESNGSDHSGFGARFERPPLGLLDAIRDLSRERDH